MAEEFRAVGAENRIENDSIAVSGGFGAPQEESVAERIVDRIAAEESAAKPSRAEFILGAVNAAAPVAEPAVEPTEEIAAEPKSQVASYRKTGFRYGCYRFVKRTFDIFSSALFMIVFSWLYIILLIVVRCSDGGPAIFRHKRVGRNRKEITVPKFRSMKRNAERLQDILTPEQYAEYKKEYKLDNDPRVTELGKVLRKTSLDEFPNVWAIFTGKMSVIGPRPVIEEELEEKYGEDADKLVSVRPGMIGWWAANGRSNTTYTSGERQKLELYYVENCSCLLDLKIIFKTIGSVFKRTGAK